MNVVVLPGAKVLLAEFTNEVPLALVCLGVRVQGGRVLELLPANVTIKDAAVAFFEMYEANVSQEVAGIAETFIAMVARVRLLGVDVVSPGISKIKIFKIEIQNLYSNSVSASYIENNEGLHAVWFIRNTYKKHSLNF